MSDLITRGRKALKRIQQKNEQEQWIYGTVGRLRDGEPEFDVKGRSNFVYVTIKQSNGAQTSPPARNDPGVPKALGTPVRMKLEAGVYVIDRAVKRSDLALSQPLPPNGVRPHLHGLTTLSDVPAYTGSAGKVLAVRSGEDGAEWITIPGAIITSVNGQTGDVELTTDDVPEGTDPDRLYFTTTEAVKLASVETEADVTDAANVLAAGAVMTSGDQNVGGLKIFTALLTALNLQSASLVGGAAANDDLTLQGTSHATRTTSYILMQPNGGFVAFGPGTPTVVAHVFGNFAVQDGALFSVVPAYGGAGHIPAGVLMSGSQNVSFLPGSAGGSNTYEFAIFAKVGVSTWYPMARWVNVASGAPSLQLVPVIGNVLIGSGVTPATASPRALVHQHNGTHGWITCSCVGIVGSAQTIVADGTGDVTGGVILNGIARNALGQNIHVNTMIAVSGTYDATADGGTNTLRFAVSAGGALTVIRQAGSSTWTFGGYLCWV